MSSITCRMTWFCMTLLLLSVHAASDDVSFPIVTSVDDVKPIEDSHLPHVLLVISSADESAKDKENADEQGEEVDVGQIVQQNYPSFTRLATEFSGMVTFGIVDLAMDRDALLKKWTLPAYPALVIYQDEPKKNPYTGNMYRDATPANVALLDHPNSLKKTLKDAIPSLYVTQLTTAQATKTQEFTKLVESAKKNDDKIVLLVSKHKKPSHLFRALSTEFHAYGLQFMYTQQETYDPENENPVLKALKVESLPTLLVIESMDTIHVLDEKKMKTFADLKDFVKPFATAEAKETTSSDQDKAKKQNAVSFLTSETFDHHVLQSKVTWIVQFMNAEQEAQFSEKERKKTLIELQKKAGVIAFGAVRCSEEAALCEQYGGPGFRVFPIQVDAERPHITERDQEHPVLPTVFKNFDAARDAAMASLPDLVEQLASNIEMNDFVVRALKAKALPALLFTKKKGETPPMLKALALSFPTQKVMYGIIVDADPQVKAQFTIPPSSSTGFVCLVPGEPDPDQPASVSPFGVLLYDKKMMGSYNYPNLMRFLMSVLSEHPHPNQDALADEEATSGSETETTDPNQALVPYLTKHNFEQLCTNGNKICAIAFFEQHIDTLPVPESPLNQSMNVLTAVARRSKAAKEPFHFMWTNGKCQHAFAEAFGVGLYQMPTIVVYAPSKQRSATNLGLFNEENTGGFLRGVLAGTIPTSPIASVPDLADDCSYEQVHADELQTADEDEEDLSDLLSEIMDEEQQQREALAKQLKEEQAAKKKDKKDTKDKKDKKDKKSKKSKGKKKSKKSKRSAKDEL